MDKQTFLETLHVERVKWKALLDEVGEDRMNEPGVCGTWSVRDLIAHVGIWTRWATYLSKGVIEKRAMSDEELFGKPLPPEVEAMVYDPFNEWLVERTQGKSLSEIMKVENTIYRNFVNTVERLDEDDFTDPARQFPGMEWKGERPLWDVLANQSYNHYKLHVQDIRAWLAGQ